MFRRRDNRRCRTRDLSRVVVQLLVSNRTAFEMLPHKSGGGCSITKIEKLLLADFAAGKSERAILVDPLHLFFHLSEPAGVLAREHKVVVNGCTSGAHFKREAVSDAAQRPQPPLIGRDNGARIIAVDRGEVRDLGEEHQIAILIFAPCYAWRDYTRITLSTFT